MAPVIVWLDLQITLIYPAVDLILALLTVCVRIAAFCLSAKDGALSEHKHKTKAPYFVMTLPCVLTGLIHIFLAANNCFSKF